ncbi:MAG: PIN domain-containing protein [Propionibacteriaceae bacterium]|nr:PIN domain-containing protein [Propionibacteriaceae bacterium]
MVVDTSALMAFFDAKDRDHARVEKCLMAAPRPLVVSSYVVAELDYLVLTRYGVHAEVAALTALNTPAWRITSLEPDELTEAINLVSRYEDERIGLADAANVVLARRYATRQIATLDRRHFSVLRFSDGSAVDIVPS